MRIFFGVFILFLFACNSETFEVEDAIQSLDKELLDQQNKINSIWNEGFNTITNSKLDSISVAAFKNLYGKKKMFWNNGYVLNQSAHQLINHIQNAHLQGLSQNFYKLDSLVLLDSLIKKSPKDHKLLNQAELIYSKTALQYFAHIKYGFSSKENKTLVFSSKIDSLNKGDIKNIIDGIEKQDLNHSIQSLEPQFYAYRLLKKSVPSFYKKTKQFKDTTLSITYHKQDSVKSVKDAYSALVLHEYLKKGDSIELEPYIKALKKFQIDHGLKPDGRVGKATAYALSRSNQDRMYSIIASIEHLKQNIPDSTSLMYVNIPSYQLKIIENNKVVDTHRVVVGRTWNRTPTFSAKMKYVILNPMWHIPYSISSKEILPKLKRDPSIASRKGYRIVKRGGGVVNAKEVNWNNVNASSFNYRITQTRSGGTALGKVKFIFPNKHSIYFHDTPSKRLFKNDIRAYSHGCVRIHEPMKLASYILSKQDTTLSQDSLQNYRGGSKRINLEQEILVDIDYYTCEGTKDGKIIFYRDIYDREKDLKALISSKILENKNKNG